MKNQIRELPCPVCKHINPVAKANLRIKCNGCGAKLLSVKVKKPNKQNFTKHS